jgi:hypothetical protein
MFKRFTPFFNVDGAPATGTTTDLSGDWGSIARSVMEQPADDGQPDADPEAEALEAEPNAEGQDVVEPDPDAETQEEPADTDLTFNDDTEVDLGEGRQPVKLAELKQGYLRQSDYTKKTQELATQRKEFETERQEWEPVKQLNDFLTNNPWLSEQITGFVKEFQQTGAISIEEALNDAVHGQYINHLLAENKKLTKELDGLRGEHEGLKLSSEMTKLQNELKAEYGDLVTDEYMNTLQERGKAEKLSVATLKEIAEGNLTKQKLQQTQTDKKKLTKETEAKTIQKLQEQRSATPPQPRQTGQRPADEAPDIGSMGWLELAKHAAGRK